jgi:uncharacterized phiE125 gp8 family phage protein
MPLSVINPPATAALNVEMLKEHLRLKVSPSDSYDHENTVLNLICDAVTTAYQERFKVQLIQADLCFCFKSFKKEMELPRPPLLQVLSVQYYDESGELVTIPDSQYEVTLNGIKPGFIRFKNSFSLPPASQDHAYPVKVNYTAGYGSDPESVDKGITLYLLNTAGTYYYQREKEIISYAGAISVHEMAHQMNFLIKGKSAARRLG